MHAVDDDPAHVECSRRVRLCGIHAARSQQPHPAGLSRVHAPGPSVPTPYDRSQRLDPQRARGRQWRSGYLCPRRGDDLLGVPESDRPEFLAALGAEAPEGNRVGALDGEPVGLDPLQYLDDKFAGYLAARRAEPRDDVLSGMAAALYPDGSTPELIELVKPATFLFAAGQETVTKLLSAAVQVLADHPAHQQMLREKPQGIPMFIEEALRMHSPTKVDFRLVRHTTELGGVHLPAGTVVMLCVGAANRDPRKFEDPHEFRPERKNVREHIAFGRGIHTCAGAPLARVEGQITVRRLLDRMSEIRVDEKFHGPSGARNYAYEPTFLLRGLTELHIEFDSAS